MNKFLILIAAFLCVFQFSKAQTEKGNQTLGLNVSFNNSSYSTSSFDNSSFASSTSNGKNTNFLLGPLYSYFIADKVDLGASFTLNSFTNSATTEGTANANSNNHNKSYEALLYMRKYLLYANKIGIRTGPYLGYAWGDQGNGYRDPQSNFATSQKGHTYEAGAKLEAVYYPSKRIGVSAMIANLNYGHFTNKNISNTTIENTSGNNVNLSFINNGLTFSLFYTFEK